jgi:nucleoside-diphosphate-sugar epimerase
VKFLEALRGKRIGIIGLGYIGSNIYEYLCSKKKELGIEVIGLTQDNIGVVESERFDYLINCAGKSGDFRQDPVGTVESNICLQVYLLKNAKVSECYVALSSTRVYGFSKNRGVVFDESCYSSSPHISLDFIYDGSKKLMESLLMNSAEKVGYRVSIVRLSNVYGNFKALDDTTLIKKIVRAKIENRTFKTDENKDSEKDYIYISDAIEGILRAMIIPKKSSVFNIASGESNSISNVAKLLNIVPIYNDKQKEQVFSHISIKKANAELKFKPAVGIEEGLKKTIGA